MQLTSNMNDPTSSDLLFYYPGITMFNSTHLTWWRPKPWQGGILQNCPQSLHPSGTLERKAGHWNILNWYISPVSIFLIFKLLTSFRIKKCFHRWFMHLVLELTHNIINLPSLFLSSFGCMPVWSNINCYIHIRQK